MALYREGKAAMSADGTVTGTGTKWQSSLSLIRPGATIMFLSSPIQMAVVNKVVSDTEIKAITTNGAVVASTDYAILLSDSLTVDGLAQDVAETLRYYQSQETVIADAVEFFKNFDFDSLQDLANQIKADSEAAESSAAAASASENAAKTSETNAKASENAAKNSEVAVEATRDQVQQIINEAGEQSTLVALSQPDGIYRSGWKRNPITKAISKAGERLDAMPISIWEQQFVDLITDKPTSDPNTWDWSPAITAAINYAADWSTVPMGTATRYSSWYLDFTPGKYIVRSQVKVDFSSMTFDAGKPLIKIRMNGAYISSAIDKDHAVWFMGCRIDVDEFRFTKEGNINAYYLKLGSEQTNNTTAVGGRISDLRCYYPTKGITFGQGYDLVIDETYMSGFTAVDDDDTENPATAIHFLSHANDNCNNIVFIRIHLETSMTANYVAIKADDNQAAGQPHHNIKFLGGHVEPHFRGAKWFDLGVSNEINFDTVVFTDNGSNEVDPASYNLGMLATSVQRFDGCTFQTNNLSAVAYNPEVHKSLLKFYPGNATSREFNTCYFATAFANVSGAGNFNAAIDATATTNGNNSYRPNNCSLNNFNRRVSGGNIYSDLAITSRKYLVGVDSADSALKWTYNNTDMSYNGGTVVMSLSTSGLLATSGGLRTGGNIASGAFLQAGVNNTTAGNRDVSFYPYGNNTMSARILADNGGGLTITNNSTAINYVANAGVSAHIFTGTIRPNVTATYNLGSSTITFNNAFLQNAPTIVSDENHKELIQNITDELLDVWGTLDFQMWKMKAAIAEKGEDDARWHFGLIAQRVKEALTNAGLDWTRYGLITYEKWDAQDEIIVSWDDEYEVIPGSPAFHDEDGNLIQEAVEERRVLIREAGSMVTQEARDAGEIYMLRMEECFAVEAAYQRRRMDRIEAAISALNP